MDIRFSHVALPLLGAASVALIIGACSSDKGTDTPNTGGAAGMAGAGGGISGAPSNGGAVGNGGAATGGVPAAGGMPAATGGAMTGGAAGAGGAGGSMGGAGGAAGMAGMAGYAGDAYVCSGKAPVDPGMTGAAAAPCCNSLGTCKDPASVTDMAKPSYGHETCGPTLLCAPNTPAAAPIACTTKVGTSSADGLEGRCVPKCFLLGNPLGTLLDDGTSGGGTPCSAGSVCAPCFNPVDGKSTGACNTGTDMPTKSAPTPYQVCPKGDDAGQDPGGGLCVPQNVVEKLKDKTNPLYNPAIPGLKQDNCAMGEVCVPAEKAANPGFCSPHCTTSTTLQTAKYANGACQPQYVIYDTNGTAGVMLVGGDGATACPTGQLCAPCGNPLTGGSPSGACF